MCPAEIRNEVDLPIDLGNDRWVIGRISSFTGLADHREHVAMTFGSRQGGVPLVRLHSECLTGDVFGSQRCDCGPQFREAVNVLSDVGGVLLYLRQEGRDIGLYNKLDAYALQDGGLDTFAANRALGLPDDARDYRSAAEMLVALGITKIRLLSNNPDKRQQLIDQGIVVTQLVRTGVYATDYNIDYLSAKVEEHGHHIRIPEGVSND